MADVEVCTWHSMLYGRPPNNGRIRDVEIVLVGSSPIKPHQISGFSLVDKAAWSHNDASRETPIP